MLAISISGCHPAKQASKISVYIDLPRVLAAFGSDPVPPHSIHGDKNPTSNIITVKKSVVSAKSVGKLTPVDDTSAMGYEAQQRFERLITRLRRLEDSGLADERHRLERLSEEEYSPESQRLLSLYLTRLLDVITRHRPELNQTSVNEAAYASAVRERIEWVNTLRPKHRDAEDAFMQALADYEQDVSLVSANTTSDIGRLRQDLLRQVELEMDRLRKISDSRVQSQSNYALATQQDNAWDSEKEPLPVPANVEIINLPAIAPRTVSGDTVMMQAQVRQVVMSSVQILAKRQGWQVTWIQGDHRKDVTQQTITMLKGGWQ